MRMSELEKCNTAPIAPMAPWPHGNMAAMQQVKHFQIFFHKFSQASMANMGNIGAMQQVKLMFKYVSHFFLGCNGQHGNQAMGNMGQMKND